VIPRLDRHPGVNFNFTHAKLAVFPINKVPIELFFLTIINCHSV